MTVTDYNGPGLLQLNPDLAHKQMTHAEDQDNGRSNENWLSQLRGERGYEKQRVVHEDLARYLYVVAYNYLKNRQGQTNPAVLRRFSDEALGVLAQDFVQETLEKLVRDNYALLDKFKGTGRFTGWMAAIVRNQAAQELRQSYWSRRQDTPSRESDEEGDIVWIVPSGDLSPENEAILRQTLAALQNCLNQLNEDQRRVFEECIVKGWSGAAMAEELGKTENAVYILVHRAKQKLRKCLYRSGWSRDVLTIFDA